ncbi:RES domain-containing protein [Bradyrhizobium sp. 83012]|uniref:RES domain-containing protein n=1 Tax=Bradyrhizobium aeschynomenes TaxID=2734909 RepID=A0ABX2C6R3_9BRAD|nr:RES domain-containing protein [Bradyrhizobium aeschynomenes]NPU63963.1 RES domain-containing protein [Bradyrhizobium aeschynomenes]
MRFAGLAYRAHDPSWAFSPTSGEGARLKGGRFNPIGVPALYLGLTVETCALEMGHGFKHRFEPLTICCYDVDVENVVDLSSPRSRTAAAIRLARLKCSWGLELADGKEPQSWKVAVELIAAGAAGILVPSFANGATSKNLNLVLWKWSKRLPFKVTPYDPAGRLPKNRKSWK